MDAKKILLSGASVDAKVAAIAIFLDKEFPKLKSNVDSVQKLQGPQGERGANGKDGKVGPEGQKGKDGRDGRDSKDGKDGVDGQDGVSVTDARIDFDGSLVMTLSTGQEINVGEVVTPELAEKIKVTMSINSDAQKTITSGTAAPSGGVDGDIYLQFV